MSVLSSEILVMSLNSKLLYVRN